jgi:AcrR family transcriptional regulator
MSATSSYHHGNLRAELLVEAGRLLERDGADAITLRGLARALDVSHAAPGHHFSSRHELLAELGAEGYEGLADALEQGMTEASGEDKLPAAGRAYVRFALANPERYRMMFASRLLDGDCPEGLELAAQRAYMLLLEAAYGEPPTGDPTSYRVGTSEFAAWSMVHGAVMLWLDGQIGPLQSEDEFFALTDRVLTDHFG